jgi:acyl-CoA reductase-like NAD-dependent aldehyde dehydrogenase
LQWVFPHTRLYTKQAAPALAAGCTVVIKARKPVAQTDRASIHNKALDS